MKHRVLLSFLFWVCGLVPPLSAQIDTVFFDDFVDNRGQWAVYEDEKGHSKIEDGYLHHVVRQGQGIYKLRFWKLPVGRPDTFLYEVGLVPQAALEGGIAFLAERKGRKENLVGYTSLFVGPKGSRSYSYTYRDGVFWPNWTDRSAVDRDAPLVMRITYGHGRYYFFLNGVEMGGYAAWTGDVWNEWGWVLKGDNDVKIDYMLVMASESVVPTKRKGDANPLPNSLRRERESF